MILTVTLRPVAELFATIQHKNMEHLHARVDGYMIVSDANSHKPALHVAHCVPDDISCAIYIFTRDESGAWCAVRPQGSAALFRELSMLYHDLTDNEGGNN